MNTTVPVAKLQGCSILIVEDEIGPFLRELQNSLELAGAATLVARSYEDACLQLHCFDFSAVFIDYKPGSDSEFWELIEDLADLPMLLYCSSSPPPPGWEDMRFITSPARLETIVNAVARLLSTTLPIGSN
jgi:hypothetical protein